MLMFTAMEECVSLVNNNGGFTVVGWYKRGVINDKSLISSCNISNSGSSGVNPNFNSTEVDVQVDSGEISYHIVSISTSNRAFLDPTTRYGIKLSRLRFDFT